MRFFARSRVLVKRHRAGRLRGIPEQSRPANNARRNLSVISKAILSTSSGFGSVEDPRSRRAISSALTKGRLSSWS